MNIAVLLPEITLFCGGLLILMLDIFFAKKNSNFFYINHLLALIICGIAIALSFKNFVINDFFFSKLYHNSPLISLVKSFIILLLTFVLVMSLRFVYLMPKFSAEFLALALFATTGGLIMIASNDFLTFYLGLELQALSFYLLSAINTRSAKSSEAGLKYFILGCLASGLLLYGISMIYGFMGTTNFSTIAELIELQKNDVSAGFLLGIILVLIAMFFKLANAPFHMWSPDVYEGSPTIVATIFATIGKFSAVLALVLIFYNFSWAILGKIMIIVGLFSIIVGSFGAIFQKNFKRLLAFSSISHVGFVIIGFAGLGKNVVVSVIFYILIYSLISLGTFGFLNLMISKNEIDNDAEDKIIFNINSLSGLSKTNPVMALCLSLLMFSTAGIPPLAGFFSKFYILSATISSGYLFFALVAIIFSVISAFYYLRIVKIIYFDKPNYHINLDDSLAIKSIIIFTTFLNLIMLLFIENIFALLNSFIF
jgi:NADH-quinone oxidoreductase subunit N